MLAKEKSCHQRKSQVVQNEQYVIVEGTQDKHENVVAYENKHTCNEEVPSPFSHGKNCNSNNRVKKENDYIGEKEACSDASRPEKRDPMNESTL